MTLRLHVLACGQADALILELPSGRLAVIDFGHANLLDYLRMLNPDDGRRFACCVLTHAHDDHYRCLDTFIDRYDQLVDEYWFSFANAGMIRPLLRLQAAIANDDRGRLLVQDTLAIHPRTIEPGLDIWPFAPPTRDVLRPPSGRATDENNRSIVLLIRYGACTLLLGADAEEERWLHITAQAAHMGISLRSDVIKAPHHGAAAPRGMPPQLWSHLLVPRSLVAISCGRSNGKPDATTLASLPRLLVRCTGRAATCAPLPDHTGMSVAPPRRSGLLGRVLAPAPEVRGVPPCFGTQIYECDPAGDVSMTSAHTPSFLDACVR